MGAQTHSENGSTTTWIGGREYTRDYDMQVYSELANTIHGSFVVEDEYGYHWTEVEEYLDGNGEAAAKLVVYYKPHPEAYTGDYVEVLESLVHKYPIAFFGVEQVYSEGLTLKLSFMHTGDD
jgi:hypothetical protein